MPIYTAEQVRVIMAGLLSGKRPGRQAISDQEFLRWYDLPAYEHSQLIEVLTEVKNILNAMQEPMTTPKRPYQSQHKSPNDNHPTGPVAL